MLEYLKDFTSEQFRRIEEMQANDFEDATADDIELYAKWKTQNALQDQYFANREAEMRELQQQKAEAFAQQAQTAGEAIEALKEAALAKLELVKNGQA